MCPLVPFVKRRHLQRRKSLGSHAWAPKLMIRKHGEGPQGTTLCLSVASCTPTLCCADPGAMAGGKRSRAAAPPTCAGTTAQPTAPFAFAEHLTGGILMKLLPSTPQTDEKLGSTVCTEWYCLQCVVFQFFIPIKYSPKFINPALHLSSHRRADIVC